MLTTRDSEDWQRPGVDRIVANATPHGTDGQILLMHDAGGDRSQTVAALDRLLPAAQPPAATRSPPSGEAVGIRQAMRPASAAGPPARASR